MNVNNIQLDTYAEDMYTHFINIFLDIQKKKKTENGLTFNIISHLNAWMIF